MSTEIFSLKDGVTVNIGDLETERDDLTGKILRVVHGKINLLIAKFWKKTDGTTGIQFSNGIMSYPVGGEMIERLLDVLHFEDETTRERIVKLIPPHSFEVGKEGHLTILYK